MKELSLHLNYQWYEKESQLSAEDNELLRHARESMSKAYSPYSGFSVGAAARLSDGKIVAASNQENGAYPSGLCAERVTLFFANSQYPNLAVDTIAIVARDKNDAFDDIISPCGACRQVMSEKEKNQNSPMRIILASSKGDGYIINDVQTLLPFSFSLKH